MAFMAFDDFKESLSIAEELLKIERDNYHTPPPSWMSKRPCRGSGEEYLSLSLPHLKGT